MRLRATRQIDYRHRLAPDGFSAAGTPETVLLGEQASVRRPGLENLAIQQGVADPHAERRSRSALEQEYLADRPVVTRLPGGIVDTDSFIICPSEHQYLLDSVRTHGKLMRHGYAVLEDGTLERDQEAIAEREERVVVLGAQTSANYSHWLLECLVRAVLFGPLDDGSRLYLTPPLKRWQRETLTLVGIDSTRIVECKPSGFVRFEEVIAVSRAMMNVHTFIPLAVNALAALAPAGARRRRIHSSRALANRRHVTNETELVGLLARRGFETVYPEALSIVEQIALFAEAEIVLGVHGSGLTNTIFSPAGTLVIELQPEGLVSGEHAVVRTLAGIRGQPFAQIVCPQAAGMEALALGHRDITVDLDELDDVLGRVSRRRAVPPRVRQTGAATAPAGSVAQASSSQA